MIFKNDTPATAEMLQIVVLRRQRIGDLIQRLLVGWKAKLANQLCFLFTILLFRVSRRATRLENKMSQDKIDLV